MQRAWSEWFIAMGLIAVGAFLVWQSNVAKRAKSSAGLDQDANRAAFLKMLRVSEGTQQHADPYSVLYGGATFSDHSDHPALTGEWAGVSTQYGHTSAAGAYQFEVNTWLWMGGRTHYGDFGDASQDQAALDLIATVGALDDVDAGNFASAVQKLGTQWASLPSSTSGQPSHALAALQAVYEAAGGTVSA